MPENLPTSSKSARIFCKVVHEWVPTWIGASLPQIPRDATKFHLDCSENGHFVHDPLQTRTRHPQGFLPVPPNTVPILWSTIHLGLLIFNFDVFCTIWTISQSPHRIYFLRCSGIVFLRNPIIYNYH